MVRQPLEPTGMIFLQGELWTATAVGRTPGEPPVPVGAQVEVDRGAWPAALCGEPTDAGDRELPPRQSPAAKA